MDISILTVSISERKELGHVSFKKKWHIYNDGHQRIRHIDLDSVCACNKLNVSFDCVRKKFYHVLSAPKNCLIETVVWSTHDIC